MTKAVAASVLFITSATSLGAAEQGVAVSIDPDGTVRIPSLQIPYSDLATPQAKRNFIERRGKQPSKTEQHSTEAPVFDIQATRRQVDESQKPGFERLAATFPVNIESRVIGDVSTQVVTPRAGVPAGNTHRVLINLHGGGMLVAWRYGALEESVPIASLAGMKVVTVNYRMAPEWHFPAASEDVAKVYRKLLESYRPENIGIYGCSSGADLAAQSVAWFQSHHLPKPGAIGMFGSGAAISDHWGDSNYFGSALMGRAVPAVAPGGDGSPKEWDYLTGSNLRDPLVTPAYHPEVLKGFPPSLLLSGTRDVGLSVVVYTHAQLVDLGVDAELHVWEGADHCSFAQGNVVDPDVPETRQVWKVIVRFFDKHLGRKKQRDS